MGIFSRFRDIVTSNINAMLEKAEDPEKLIKLMIQEMEDTLVEIKASCASAMANRNRTQRSYDESNHRAERWAEKARLAMEKGREDLAREALLEKRHFTDEAENRSSEVEQFNGIIDQYQKDIAQLEEKLEGARKKHRILVQRHLAAQKRTKAQTRIRTADSSDVFSRFDAVENRVERMEAEADLVNYGRKPSLDEEFAKLERDDGVEDELAALRRQVKGEPAPAKSDAEPK